MQVQEEEDPDTEGILEEDIDLVMRHANATKVKAVQALKNNDNDVINAILEIEMAFGLSQPSSTGEFTVDYLKMHNGP